jgi:hypothetical protein
VTDVPGPDPEAAYYQAVEEYFVSRRGEPLILSNADWHLVRKWRTAGLPLRVVLRGIRDALDAHAHGWSRDRRVRSLAYCTHEVEAARERWERALALGRDRGTDVTAALEGFAQDLERARGAGPRASEEAVAIAGEIRARAAAGPGARLEELTGWLAGREGRLLEAIRSDDGEERVEAVEAEVERSLAPYRERMPPRVLEQLRRESVTRRLLESHGLPRLSLFHLAGEDGGSG